MDFFKKSIITRDDTGPYLVRWTLFGCRFFSVKLHHILQSDDACLHDHPWPFISIILKGGYWEHAPVLEDWYCALPDKISMQIQVWDTERKWYKPFSIIRRPALWRHRLELPNKNTCWSLVLTGKPIREWGFWTKQGWVNHEQYDQSKQNC